MSEVLKEASRFGLRPRTDSELLPVLLDHLAAVTPRSKLGPAGPRRG
ncbi:hypothetical protein [Streptomyces sp. NPDC088762]